MLRKIVNQKGINIVPTTARHPDNVLDLLKSKLPFRSLKFKVPYIIGASGALIKDQNGQVIRKKTIDPETVKHIIEVLNKHDVLYCILTSDNKWYKVPSVRHNDYLQGDTRKFITVKGNPIKQLGNDITEILQIVPYIDPSNDEHRGKLKAIEQDLQNLKVSISSSSKRLLEIGPEGINKGEAIKFLCKLLGWDLEKTFGFGDSRNDTDTAKEVGTFIAMPNAPAELLELATSIAPNDHNHDGVAHGIKKIIEEFAKQSSPSPSRFQSTLNRLAKKKPSSIIRSREKDNDGTRTHISPSLSPFLLPQQWTT